MGQKRKGGIIYLKINGERYQAKGNFTYNLGKPKRGPVVGSDEVHGFTETPQVAFIEGEITDDSDLDLAKLVTIENATVTLELANSKTFVIREGWYAGEGTGNTEEGNIGFRVEGKTGEEI